MWCIPEASAEYVACMEDVLDLYEQPYDPKRPQVCYDEWRRALIGETRTSLPAEPGKRKRILNIPQRKLKKQLSTQSGKSWAYCWRVVCRCGCLPGSSTRQPVSISL